MQSSAVWGDLRAAVNDQYQLSAGKAYYLTAWALWFRVLIRFRWTSIPFEFRRTLWSLADAYQEHKPQFERRAKEPLWVKTVVSVVHPQALLYFSLYPLIKNIEDHLWHDYYAAAAVQGIHYATPREVDLLLPEPDDDEIVELKRPS